MRREKGGNIPSFSLFRASCSGQRSRVLSRGFRGGDAGEGGEGVSLLGDAGLRRRDAGALPSQHAGRAVPCRLPLRCMPSSDDFELLLNPDLGYDAAVKEVCHFCTFFLTHGPSIEECPRQERKLGARNRFIL